MNDSIPTGALIQAVRSAVRSYRPNPTEPVTLDLGEFGEHEATVEYDVTPADIDGSGRRDPAYLTVYSIKIPLLGDVLAFVKAQHPDCLAEITAKLERKLEAEARAARWEAM